ncbi:Phytochelatin synthase-domain-containing protein [Radiomyces spectabilis]|uniref:Phytochelatin synthase-domain-containing protein n=1 Tax=Radiomyces spectabilis TaxID=64574 RepID=UPI00221FEF89|nr:Phytochelatin synthase-domain-containing protein [Radiomyces spectabilis]KAI8378061.1 Phytochelatin synthase-domain-containing protein [Radiomyces spectabilis]
MLRYCVSACNRRNALQRIYQYQRPLLLSASRLSTSRLYSAPSSAENEIAAFQDLLGVTNPAPDLTKTFYQRQLPSNLIRFSSAQGKAMFRTAMEKGHAEGFFPLTGNFTTQSEPAYCGPSSLAMVLNALEVDPQRIWKGNWRWFSGEYELLQCCASKEDMKKNGITFDKFACLAKCHCNVEVKRSSDITFEEFKRDVVDITARSDKFMVISFSRKTLQQTGDGHFSPIGAYNPENDMVLVLDTARYKYPSYWCDIKTLYESMKPIDKETGRPRGYFLLGYDTDNPPISLCRVQPPSRPSPETEVKQEAASEKMTSETKPVEPARLNWSMLAQSFCKRIPENMWLEKPRTLEHVVQLVLRNVPSEYTAILANQSLASSKRGASPEKAREYIGHMLQDITHSPLYPIVLDALYADKTTKAKRGVDHHAAFATLFVLGSPRMLYTSLPRDLQDQLDAYRKDEQMTEVVKREVHRISVEVGELTKTFCTCGPGWMQQANADGIDHASTKNCPSN